MYMVHSVYESCLTLTDRCLGVIERSNDLYYTRLQHVVLLYKLTCHILQPGSCIFLLLLPEKQIS